MHRGGSTSSDTIFFYQEQNHRDHHHQLNHQFRHTNGHQMQTTDTKTSTARATNHHLVYLSTPIKFCQKVLDVSSALLHNILLRVHLPNPMTISIPQLSTNTIVVRQLTREDPTFATMLMLIIDIEVLPNIKRRTALDMVPDELDLRALVVLSPIKDPRERGDDEDDGESDDAVVHGAAGDGDGGGEDEEDGGDDRVGDAEQIAGPS